MESPAPCVFRTGLFAAIFPRCYLVLLAFVGRISIYFGFDMTTHWRAFQLHEPHLRPKLVLDHSVQAPHALTRRSPEWECPLDAGMAFGHSSVTGTILIPPPPC